MNLMNHLNQWISDNPLIFISIILLIVYLIIIIPFLILRISSDYYEKQFYNSYYYFTKIRTGEVLGVSGLMKTGKTSLSSVLSVIFQMDLIDKINNLFEITTLLLTNVNIDELNSIIAALLSKTDDIKEIGNFIMFNLQIKEYPLYLFGETFTSKELLNDYIEAFDAMYVRANFVYSKTRFYSPLMKKLNMYFDIKQMRINEAFNSNKFDLGRYSILIHDEASDDKSASEWQEFIKSGSKTFINKIRHIFKETTHLITIKQDATDEVKKERQLIHTSIHLYKPLKIINKKLMLRKVVKIINDFPFMFYRFFKIRIPFVFSFIKYLIKNRMILSYKTYYKEFGKNVTRLREHNKTMFYFDKFFDSLNCICFYARVYDNADDVGSKNSDLYEEIKIISPIKYAFTYPKFEFDHIYDELKAASDSNNCQSVNYFSKKRYFDLKEQKEEVIIDDLGNFD